MFTCVSTYIYINMYISYICVYAYIYIHMYVYVYKYVFICVHTYKTYASRVRRGKSTVGREVEARLLQGLALRRAHISAERRHRQRVDWRTVTRHVWRERIFIELMTSDCERKASREGSK